MAARPLRRAICAGAKKGATVAPAVVALQRLSRYCFALRSFRYKRILGAYYGHARAILSVRALLLRRPFASRSFCFAVLLHCARLVAVFAAPRKTSRFVVRVKF